MRVRLYILFGPYRILPRHYFTCAASHLLCRKRDIIYLKQGK